jgi:hypothetical protein
MRSLLALLVVVVLALPAAALAGMSTAASAGGVPATAHDSKPGKRLGEKKKKRKKQRRTRQKAKKGAKTGVTSAQAGIAGDEIEVKGPLTSLTPPTVGTLSCAVPQGMAVSGFAVGDVVKMTCAVVDATWVLRKLEREHEEQDELEAEGVIQALSPMLTVSGVSCAVSQAISLQGYAVGDRVEMKCRSVGGTWTLVRLKADDDDSSHGDDDEKDDDDDDRDEDDDDRDEDDDDRDEDDEEHDDDD